MTRNYKTPNVSDEWHESRDTHAAVATAIFAIADTSRTPEAIWEAPTAAEFDHVTMAVEEYLRHGDFARADDGRYHWGQEVIRL